MYKGHFETGLMDISAIFQNGYFIGILVIFGIEALWGYLVKISMSTLWVFWQFFLKQMLFGQFWNVSNKMN